MTRRALGALAVLVAVVAAACGVRAQNTPEVISPPLPEPSPAHTISGTTPATGTAQITQRVR